MAEDEIVQQVKVEVEGADQVSAEFKKIGDSAGDAFNKLSKDAEQVSASTEKVVDNVVKLGQTFKSGFGQGIGNVFGPLVEQVNKLTGGTFSKLGQSVAAIGKSFTGLRSAISGIGPAFAVIRTNFLAAEAAGRGATAGTEALAASFAALGPSVGAVGIALGALAATSVAVGGALLGLASSASNAAASMKESAISIGTGVEELQKLTFAAEQSGASAGQLERALRTLVDPPKEAADALEELGVRLTDAGGRVRDPIAVFTDLADKISKIKNPADQAAAASQVFGRRLGPELVELLSQGSAGIDAFGADLQRLGGIITDADTLVGKAFTDAVGRLGAALSGLKNQIGLAFSPQFTALINSFADAVAAIAPTIIEVAKAVSKDLTAAFAAIGEIFAPVVAAFQEVIRWAGLLLDAVNELFGTNITGTQVAAFIITLGILATAFAAILLVIGLVIGAFAALTGAIAGAVASGGLIIGWAIAIGLALGTLAELVKNFSWDEFVAKVQAAWNEFKTAVQTRIQEAIDVILAFPNQIANVWKNIVQVAQAAWNSIVQGAKDLPGRIVTAFNNLLAQLQGLGARIAQALSSAWDDMVRAANEAVDKAIAAIGRLLARIAEAALKLVGLGSAAGASEGGAFAQGGRVYGSGTGTSDSIPAWLSHGEWVIRAAAVRKYGHALFAMLNNMRIPANHIKQLLANGGFVPTTVIPRSSPLHFAGGGAVDSPATMRALNLTILGETFTGLLAPDDVAERLERFAVNRQVKSAGRKPGYYRG